MNIRLRHGRAVLALAWLLLSGLLGGCATNPVTGTPDLVLLTEREEIALGARHHQQVLAQYRVYEDANLHAYVAALGASMAEISDRPELDYRFTLLDTEEFNAFALAGGYIYVTRGLLAHLNSEAELAGVLGHEIGHVAARHAVRQHTPTRVRDLLGELLFDRIGLGGDQVYEQLSTVLMRGYERRHELEADRLAATYLARRGYDPAEMAGVVRVLTNQEKFERLRASAEGREPRVYHGLFSSHPDNERRLREVIEAARAETTVISLGANREAYLRRIEGLVLDQSQAQGRIIGQHYLHGPSASGLHAPPGWTLDNSGQILTLAPPSRDAVIQIIHERRRADTDPRALLLELLGAEGLSDETELGDGELRGWAGTGLAQTPFGQAPVRVAGWLNGDHAWIFFGASRNAGTFAAEIEASIRSFHRLNARELAQTRPLRLAVIAARPGMTYASLAADSPLGEPEEAEARLRLLNGQLDPADQPRPGELIKIARL